ncbi:MAG: UDP-forming cellulose synthase catalytic subunit [Pigmentiphaga sp.]|uniref:UDP-forming cellulose synthase catalytic subunit n=1 Tax=Pigmentiphaga sp. TaxID=1977564 RepID=UPI003B53F941
MSARLDDWSAVLLRWSGWHRPVVRVITVVLAALLFALAVTVPLELGQQAVFAAACFGLALVLSTTVGRLAPLAMIVLSVTASLRYMYWRLTSTVGFENLLDAFFGFGLVAAELYALVVLLLGYFQTAWPLERKPAPMPPDPAMWPTVDVFIPTYNEPLDVVRQTVYTAIGLDWPADKLKVFVLDDGKRPEFRAFCEELGVGYVTRDNNAHAKAGNINHALELTSGEYVAIFDCDHVPTRSFLQICMGWFLRDPKLAMLQTPHFFFSPDPFEKNLDTFRVVPNEGELFYGLVQDGNDLWNATFFCGSCAMIRRGPLMEIGGVAVETVTEDAHTALKLNRRGYNTAYLAIPQAAGLATESLARHVGQRIRWARGMAQICRVDNPLLGPGLTLGQRLCYLNAMLHFFYGLPRLIFLTAPLAYLLLGAHVFQATALMITAYAVPHIFHASLTNSRMQGRFRHSFWNEVYESVLAWYILRPALVAFVNPKAGKFNVTDKGGVTEEGYFDWDMARPYIVLLVLNLAGFLVGAGRLVFQESPDMATVLINLAWTVYNLIMTSAAVAVAGETRQVRRSPRVATALPASLMFGNGKTLACQTIDFSQTGLGLRVPADADVPMDELLHVSLYRGTEEGIFPATAAFRRGDHLGLQFKDLNVQQEVELAQMTFARADTWAQAWGSHERDSLPTAFAEILRIAVKGFWDLARSTGRLALFWRRDRRAIPSIPETGDQ